MRTKSALIFRFIAHLNAALNPATPPASMSRGSALTTIVLVMLVGLWTYWVTLGELMHIWFTEPDYSHGFLVPFVAGVVLYLRRESLPPLAERWSLWGVAIIAMSMGLKIVSGLIFFDALDYWSLVVWLLGVVTLFFGVRVALWTWPALAFLLLAMPLPFRVEQFCSQPLQRIATQGSVWMLQTLGQSAFAEGNVILLGDRHLEVERACAGLRIFVGIAAMTLVAAALSRRSLLERVLLFASALPVAVLANILRIVATAICYVYGPAYFADALAHDAAGWLMIPLAIALIGAVYWYLAQLVVTSSPMVITDVMQRHRS